jgi:hypothetical protein
MCRVHCSKLKKHQQTGVYRMSLSTRSPNQSTSSVPQLWYKAEDLETLTYVVSNQRAKFPVYKFVFLPQDRTTSFVEQLRSLQMLKNTLKATHACFIAMEPGDFETSHYIFGVLINRSLFIINPVGESGHAGLYEYLEKAKKALGLDKVYVSNTPIQKDKAGLISCGPICIELMWHFANLSAAAITQTLQSLVANSKTLKSFFSYDVVDIAETSLLPAAFQGITTDSAYLDMMTQLRARHLNILTQNNASLPDDIYDERTLMNQMLTDKMDMISLLNEETFKNLERRFHLLKQALQTPSLSSTASLQMLSAVSPVQPVSSMVSTVIPTVQTATDLSIPVASLPRVASPSVYGRSSSPTHFKQPDYTIDVRLDVALLSDEERSDENETSSKCCRCTIQ